MATLALTRNQWAKNYKGALGCFLGHTRAWEIFVTSKAEFALIVEDDVSINNAELLEHLVFPESCDIAFCNDRTCYVDGGSSIANDAPYEFRAVEPVFELVARVKQGIGSDGYILTRRGAMRLLEFVSIDSLFSHVDLRMAAYCLEQGTCTRIEAIDSIFAKNVVAMRRTYQSSHHLSGYSFSPSITHHLGGESRRDREDRAGLTSQSI